MLSRKSLMLWMPLQSEAVYSSTPSLAPFAGVHYQVAAAAAAPHAEQHAVAFDFFTALHGFVRCGHSLPVDFQDHVAGAQSRCGRRRSRVNVHHKRALDLIGDVELPT